MALNRKFLFGSTVLAGFVAVTVAAAPAAAQTPQPPVGSTQAQPLATGPVTPQSNPADQASGADETIDAQDDVVDDPTANEVDAVVVTGSRIRRSPVNSPTPLIQLGREEILQSGEANVIDFLADIPALSGSIVPEDTTGSNLNDGGLSLLNLRDLGAVRTLVLVDGRRHVGSAPGSLSVDVDTIPSLLIQNVEIVTGGQSALYGADAVSGVVNFILRRNFDGIEIDVAGAQINQEDQYNGHVQALVGRNFLDGRLNVYGYAAYQHTDEVLDLDIDWKREARGFLFDDSDPGTASNDGVLDTNFVTGLRDSVFSRGGTLVLANQPRPSPVGDPDTPFQNCGAVPANRNSFFNATNCGAIRPDNPGSVFQFNADGSARLFDFGSRQAQAGFTRRAHIGGDGLNSGTEFGQGSRLPESTAYRFQGGVNFDITSDIQLFAEAKFVHEETFDAGQPTFFQIGVVPILANQTPVFFGNGNQNIGLDNAFLPANVRLAIENNRRPVFNAAGVQTGELADPRAQLTVFGPSRTQFNERELTRYVIGLRGDRDRLGFINNFAWEAGYTHGEVDNSNRERGVDSERFFFATDTIRNAAGQIVCRVQDYAARGIVIPDQNRNSPNASISPTDPRIAACTPTSLFGTDFRADASEDNITGGGNRPGLTQAQADYFLAEIEVTNRNEQDNFLAFASGELWDFWGAGPIGVAGGYEYRQEKTSGTGRDRDTMGRILFLNTGPDFPEASYEANEAFGEFRLPLLRDVRFAQALEISGAYRYSDYTTVGEVRTYSLQGSWRPYSDLLFRTTYGQATRIPNLGENFAPPTQTFANGFVDPCDANNIRAIDDPTQRANRRANCVSVLGAGFDPGTDVPNTGTRIIYTSGVPGRNQGNPGLVPEESRSYTFGFGYTPSFFPNFSISADYYDIKITNVISAVGAATAAFQCVSGTSVNPLACATIFRNGANPTGNGTPFAVIDFIQGSLNFAATEAKGADFLVRYNFDLDYFDFVPRNAGRVDIAVRGNYLIRQEDFFNIADPGDASEFDSLVGLPRVRFLSTVTYTPIERLSLSWDWDWQSSQEILDDGVLLTNGDTRLRRFYNTGSYSTHDFSVRYEVRDNITLRGGVVNAFDNDPPEQLGSTTSADNFDFFGRRFYLGVNYRR